jgi:AcrR family transcriptional regulator
MGLALEEGIAAATADRIAAAAGVSPRTLFNYYPVKEDAILGVRAPRITSAAAQRFDAAAGRQPLLVRTAFLLADTLRSVNVPGMKRGERRRLLERHPELGTRLRARIVDARTLVRALLDERSEREQAPAIPVDVIAGLAGSLIGYCLESHQFMRFPEDDDLLEAISLFRAALDGGNHP